MSCCDVWDADPEQTVGEHPISVPGYGYNNGYYSSDLALTLARNGVETKYDVTECQVISD